MGRITTRHSVLRLTTAETQRRVDTLAVEEPLDIRLAGAAFMVTMRTPGDDIDLVHGLLLAEGAIANARDVQLVRHPLGSDGRPRYDLVDVMLAPTATPAMVAARHVLTSSACGICGTESLSRLQRPSQYPLVAGSGVAASVLVSAPDRLRAGQRVFSRTGGLHAAGLMRADGTLDCVREDVGRHNAVDKVIGWALRADRLPLSAEILVLSGRASYELTQKAVLAGIRIIVAVSAPSSLAVELADSAGLTLIGFARGTSMNVYTHPDRVVGDLQEIQVLARDSGSGR